MTASNWISNTRDRQKQFKFETTVYIYCSLYEPLGNRDNEKLTQKFDCQFGQQLRLHFKMFYNVMIKSKLTSLAMLLIVSSIAYKISNHREKIQQRVADHGRRINCQILKINSNR